MTKTEYLGVLEQKLKKSLSQDEVADILRDYTEYFDEGKNQGKGDDEICAKLGSPETIAAEILNENEISGNKKTVKDKIAAFFAKTGEWFKKFISFLGSGIKGLFHGILSIFKTIFNFIKKLKLPTILTYLLIALIGIPIGLFLAGITVMATLFAVAVIIMFIAFLFGISVMLLLPAVALIAGSGLVFEMVNPVIGAMIIILSIACIALSLCISGFAIIICRNITGFFHKKHSELKNKKDIIPKGCELNA